MILFPNDDESSMPSPYCEAQSTTETALQQMRKEDLCRYVDFQNRELPQMILERLDQHVHRNCPAAQHHLRSRLVDIVRECQSELFQTYQDSEATQAAPDERAAHDSYVVEPPQQQDVDNYFSTSADFNGQGIIEPGLAFPAVIPELDLEDWGYGSLGFPMPNGIQVDERLIASIS